MTAPAATSVRTLQFLGAAGTVTGSMFLVSAEGRRLLLDCGQFQGLKELRLRNWGPRVAVEGLDAVILSHAHLDHIGYLPVLVRQGFHGPVYCTGATADLAGVILRDAAHLEEEHAERANRRGYTRHRPALPLFDTPAVERALTLLEPRCFGEPFVPLPSFECVFRRAGHILGAATIDLRVPGRRALRLVYSGDLGRPGRPLLRDPEPVREADVLLLESTYGDRIHAGDADAALARIIRDAAARGSAVLVPAFSVGRTQELLWTLGRLEEQKQIPILPVYVDSPMGMQVTELYERNREEHDTALRALASSGRHPFRTQRCGIARTAQESRALNQLRGPVIIIAGSGMATGGRILHHLALRLPDPRTTVLLTGFQAAGTRGRSLQDGAATVRMLGQDVPVRARVEVIDALSAHADREEMLAWLSGFIRPPGITYIVHGEADALAALATQLRERLRWPARVPRLGETVEL
jgi:metallo-beta-lactamase family protein